MVVMRFFGAVNTQDVSALVPLLADRASVLCDLGGVNGLACGQPAVARFYTQLLAALPLGAVFVLEDCTCGHPTKVGTTWRMDVDGTTAPCSSGVTFFTLSPGGDNRRITCIRQAPEHTVKLGHSAQSASGRLATGLPLAVGRQLLQAMPAPLTDVLLGLASSSASSALLVTGTPPAGVVRQLHQQQLRLPSSSGGSGGVAPDQRRALGYSSGGPARLVAPPGAAPRQGRLHMEGHATLEPPRGSLLSQGVTALQGIWCKDAGASDQASFERALDVWGIQGVQRATARLIEGMGITVVGRAGKGVVLNVKFLTVIPVFNVVETFASDAPPRKVGRRDLRPGHELASLEVHGTGNAVTRLALGQPVAGNLEERYELSSDGQTRWPSRPVWRWRGEGRLQADAGRVAAGATRHDGMTAREWASSRQRAPARLRQQHPPQARRAPMP